MTDELHNNGRLLKQLLPYINEYRNANFLFVVPSYLFANDKLETSIWEDIAACNSLGIKCLVFIDFDWDLDPRSGISEQQVKDKLPNVAALETLARYKLSQEFYGYNKRVDILSGAWLLAQPKGVLQGNDLQSYGKLRSVDQLNIINQLAQGNILILSNTAPDKHGRIYALDGHNTAVTLASSSVIDKVILYVEDLPTEYKQVAVSLSEAQRVANSLTKQEKQSKATKNDGFAKSVMAAVNYCTEGIKRTHILPSNEDGALFQEILTADGYGFMVNLDDYEQMTVADHKDVQDIKRLIAPWEEKGALRPRSTEDIQRAIGNFCVIKQDNNIIGCAALSPIAARKGYAELECVVVSDSHKRQGYGKRLLHSMEKMALSHGYSNLAVFTTQTSTWFEDAGYKASKVELPVPDYCKHRNSKCLIKPLKAKTSKTKSVPSKKKT